MTINDEGPATGVSDTPVVDQTQDRLGFGKGTESLSRFITNCETPMTIGIQGGWGTGKTSLMQLISGRLDKECIQVSLNTWQYAQVYDKETLPLWVIAGLARKLWSKLPPTHGAYQDVKHRFGAKFLRSMFGNLSERIPKEVFETTGDKLDMIDGSFVVEDIHLVFHRAVEALTEKSSAARIVFFIDDIDRVPPQVAVSLLEAIKNFIDVPRCVFVLAVDFEVVRRGLEERGAVDGRDFFDKIIQVPYSLKPHTYESERFVISHLVSMGGLSENHVRTKGDLRRFIESTTRSNPRTIKRALNLYAVLCGEASGNQLISEAGIDPHHRLVIFALSCLQVSSAYHVIYEALTQTTCPEVVIFMLARATDEQFAELSMKDVQGNVSGYHLDGADEAIGRSQECFELALEGLEGRDASRAKLDIVAIAVYIRTWINRDSDERISGTEAKHFRAVLDISSATAIAPQDKGGGSRTSRVAFIDLLNGGIVTEAVKFWFRDPKNPDERSWAAYPVFEERQPRVVREWGGQKRTSSTPVPLAELTHDFLKKKRGEQVSRPAIPQQYWVIEDGSEYDGMILSDAIQKYRDLRLISANSAIVDE